MASENETVESVIANARKELDYGEGVLLHLTGKRANEIFDCIEEAHKREVAELRELLKTILPYAEAGYCTRKTTHGCTGCPLSSIVSGAQYAEPICRIFKWRKVLEGVSND